VNTPRNLVISDGPIHQFERTSELVAGHLDRDGITSVIISDIDEALECVARDPRRWDLITVNALRWRMLADRHEPQREQWAFTIGTRHEQALDHYVRGGGGLLALHTAVICFDGSQPWHDLTGGSWNWERSSHPPLGEVAVTLTDAGRRHPVTEGIADFTITDEAYGTLDLAPDVEPLATTRHGGVDHPLLWARTVDEGRVVTDLLGHGPESMSHPDHGKILRAAAGWARRREAER
jgi:type 1 glutamine amidotransferase